MFFKMDDFLFSTSSGRGEGTPLMLVHMMYHMFCHVMYHMFVLSRDVSHVCIVGAERRGASDHVTLHHVRWRHHDADELLQHHVVTWYRRLWGGHAQEAVSG